MSSECAEFLKKFKDDNLNPDAKTFFMCWFSWVHTPKLFIDLLKAVKEKGSLEEHKEHIFHYMRKVKVIPYEMIFQEGDEELVKYLVEFAYWCYNVKHITKVMELKENILS